MNGNDEENGNEEERMRFLSEKQKLNPLEEQVKCLQLQIDIDAMKGENISLENQQLKDRLLDLESNYKQLEYCFKKVLNDQQYLLQILNSDEKIIADRPQIKRISDEFMSYFSIFECKTTLTGSPDSEDTSNNEDSERMSNVSRQIKLKSLIKPSRFNILRCFNTDNDSSPSPEEKPKKTHFFEEDPKNHENEEYEKLEIQPFSSEKTSPNELKDTIIEKPQEEENTPDSNLSQNGLLIPRFHERILEETVNSPQLKIKHQNLTNNQTVDQPPSEDQDKYVEEIIKRHRKTFSKRIMESNKTEKPEELEQSYMSAMGKSIIAFNYKPKISRNPLKKFNTFYPQSSVEETKSPETQFSPSNKVTLIPVRKCFKMESMQEIHFNRNSNSSNLENPQPPILEKQEIVSNITSIAEEEPIEKEPIEKEAIVYKIGSKIFEDLIIIGVDKNDINSMDPKEVETQKIGALNPKILYSFRNEAEAPELAGLKKILPDYCFPYKLNVEKVDIGSSMSYTSVLMVMYPTHNLWEGRDKCFIMTLSCDDTYKNHEEDGSLLHRINPNRILHCICYQTIDYIESSDPQTITKKSKLHRKFWTCPKVYCFVTFYPIVKFFFDLLVEITNNLKLFRLEVMDKFVNSKKKEFLYQIDSDFLTALIQEHIEGSLKELQTFKIPTFGDKLSLKLKRQDSNVLGYQLQDPDYIEYEEALWGAPLTFSNLPLEDFIFLLFSFLLETKIVFFSKNLCLLTSTILTFFNLIKPVKWVHPILCSLPDSLLDFLGSPVPIIAGINQNRQFFKDNNFAAIYPDCLYYFLDDNKLAYDEINIKETLKLIPSMNHFKKQLAAKPYKTFTRVLSKIFDFEVSSPKKTWKQFKGFLKDSKIYSEKNLIYLPNAEQESQAFEIFQIFKTMIKSIFENLPENPKFLDEEKTNLNQEYIVEEVTKKFKSKKDKEFLKRFLKTQIAFSYIETRYKLN